MRRPTFDPGKRHLNKMEYWADHVSSWLNADRGHRLLSVRYEDWLENYRGTLRLIGQHVGLRKKWVTRDVRMGRQRKKHRLVRTWVEPRKGVVGDHVNYFCQEDADVFWNHCREIMQRFGYRPFQTPLVGGQTPGRAA